MEKTLYIITFNSGSEYRVYSENKTQEDKLLRDIDAIKEDIKSVNTINWLHSQKDFANMLRVMNGKNWPFFEKLNVHNPQHKRPL